MDAWVIGDHDDLNDRIRKSLECAGRGFAFVHVLSTAACRQLGVVAPKPGDMLLYSAMRLTAHDLESLRQLRDNMAGTITVVSSMTDNDVVLRAIRAGAEDFFDANGDLEQEIADFLSKTCAHHGNKTAVGRLVAVLAGHAPIDASFLATNLATVIAQKSGSCALLDLHRQGGDPALLLKLTPRHTLLDLLDQRQEVDRVMFEQALVRHHSGVGLLAGSKRSAVTSNDAGIDCREIMELAQATHPSVIVLADDVHRLAQLTSMAVYNQLVIATRLDLLSLQRCQRDIEILRQNHVPAERIEVVAISSEQSGELPIAAVAKSLALNRVHTVTYDAVAVTVSTNLGHPLVLEFPNSPTSLAIKRLAQALEGVKECDRGASSGGRLASARAAALGAVSALVGRGW
jgi:Flp pilus assembly CpaE family ATPase